IGVHCLEDALVGRLKFQQGNGPVTVAVHDGKEHCRHASSQDPPSWLLGPSCPFLDPSPGPNQARSANPSSHHRLRYHLEQRGAEFGCSVAGAPAPIAAAGFVASAKPTPSGGFSVAFEKIGLNEKRAKYDRDNRTIYINLEHPRVAV